MGFRLPAEWEPHAATWLSWPHNERWPGKFGPVPGIFVEMVRALVAGERVEILALSREHAASISGLLTEGRVDLSRVGLHVLPTDDASVRHGPIFLRRDAARPCEPGEQSLCKPSTLRVRIARRSFAFSNRVCAGIFSDCSIIR